MNLHDLNLLHIWFFCEQLKALESMVDLVKVEDRRLSISLPSTPKTGEKSKSPFKGSGSPFKCIGKGISQQITSELDAEVSAQRCRIEELEAIAASRQKEVSAYIAHPIITLQTL